MTLLNTSFSGGGVAAPSRRGGEPGIARDSIITSKGEYTRRHWFGVVGSTWWFHYTGDSTNEVWDAYIEHCHSMAESDIERRSLVCIAHHAETPTGEQRRMIGDFIDANKDRLETLVGFALVLDSPLHILALKAVTRLVRKPFPEHVCGSPTAAASWLQALGAPIDPGELLSALRECVPREFL